MSHKRVLYLSYDGLSDPLGQSQVLPYVVGLAKTGYDFVIVSFEKRKALKARYDEIKIICTTNKIEWIPLTYHKHPPVLSTVYDVWRLWLEVRRAYHQNEFQIIHCRSYITALIGLRAKRKWGVKFIFDMRGFWVDERLEGGLWNLRNPIFKIVYSFFKVKEKQFLREADQVISLTENAKKEIESWEINSAPIQVIPTCVDLDLFDPKKIGKEEQALLRYKLSLNEDDFVLLYLGSWGTWYLTNEMLDFFLMLKQKRQRAKFLIVTGDKVDLGNHPNKEDVIVTYASRKQVPLYISLASASLCFIKPSFSKKASSATKLGELMALNVPIIANTNVGDHDSLFKENSRILLINGFSPGEFHEAISRLDELMKAAKQNPKLAMQRFSLQNGVTLYGLVYKA